jgi:hypothetical protein
LRLATADIPDLLKRAWEREKWQVPQGIGQHLLFHEYALSWISLMGPRRELFSPHNQRPAAKNVPVRHRRISA